MTSAVLAGRILSPDPPPQPGNNVSRVRMTAINCPMACVGSEAFLRSVGRRPNGPLDTFEELACEARSLRKKTVQGFVGIPHFVPNVTAILQ